MPGWMCLMITLPLMLIVLTHHGSNEPAFMLLENITRKRYNTKIKYNYELMICQNEWIMLLSKVKPYICWCRLTCNMRGTTNGAGPAYSSRVPRFTPCGYWDSCCSIFSIWCNFSKPLFFILSFFFWPLLCPSFFGLP